MWSPHNWELSSEGWRDVGGVWAALLSSGLFMLIKFNGTTHSLVHLSVEMEATFAEYEEWSEEPIPESVLQSYQKALGQLEKYKPFEEALVSALLPGDFPEALPQPAAVVARRTGSLRFVLLCNM